MSIKDSFKSKFSKERVSKFFDKEGFYIVLFLCVCIVAITAVWVSRSGVKDSQNLGDANDNKPAVSAPSQETSAQNNQVKQPEASTAKVTKGASEEKKTAEVPKKDTSSIVVEKAKTTSVQAAVNFANPFKDALTAANVVRDYSQSDLICYESVGEWRTHLGIDMKSSEGTEVLAVYDGKVVDIKNDNDYQGGLGWTVVVDHNNGYQSVYSNLDEKIDVKKNQTVKKGQKIGMVGQSSFIEKPKGTAQAASHLHFELLKKGAKAYENVDPKQYLTMQN